MWEVPSFRTHSLVDYVLAETKHLLKIPPVLALGSALIATAAIDLVARPLDCFDDHFFGDVRFSDFVDFHPFIGLEVFVVAEKVFDLLDCDFRQIRIFFDAFVAPSQTSCWDGDDFFVWPLVCLLYTSDAADE